MSDFGGLYDVRDAIDSDASFVLSTFLRGLYYGNSWFGAIPKRIFMENYKRVAQGLIASPNVVIKVACLKEDPNVILGYSILSADYLTIHYCFVKTPWRGKGIAKSLCPKYPHTVTHLTELGKTLMIKIPTAQFNPFFTL